MSYFRSAQLTGPADPHAKERFITEARSASFLDHPNIATIYEIDVEPDTGLFIAMAYYEGAALDRQLSAGPVPFDRAVEIVAQVGDALARAHARGIVHRDIKPANILMTSTGVAKVIYQSMDSVVADARGLLGTMSTITGPDWLNEAVERATSVAVPPAATNLQTILTSEQSAERRQATVLASGLRNLAALADSLDPEDLHGCCSPTRPSAATSFVASTATSLIHRAVRRLFGLERAGLSDADKLQMLASALAHHEAKKGSFEALAIAPHPREACRRRTHRSRPS